MPVSAPTITKTIQVYQKQNDFLESKALWRAFVGGIGSGKSFIGALDMIRRAKAGRLYMVTAPTYTMLSDSSFRSFVHVAKLLGVVNDSGIKESAPPVVRLLTGAEMIFRSADDPERLRGPNLSGIWMDEASLMSQEVFSVLIGRLREGSEMGWGTATFTPKGKIHWTYKIFATGQEDTFLVKARSDENPFLPPNFASNIRKRYTAHQIKQELGGDFLDAGGNHYFPGSWPRYVDMGDAYRIGDGAGRWRTILKRECSRMVALDWAMGKPKKDAAILAQTERPDELRGDCTAFVVADMSDDADGTLFLLQAINERIPLASNAPRLAELCRRWNPVVVSGDDDNLSETMLLECRRYRDIPTIKSLGIRSRNKVTRSQAAIVRAERGMVYLPEREARLDHLGVAPWVDMLSDQLSAFTGADGEPDDLADAVAILGRLADEFRPGEDADEGEPVLGSPGYDGGIW
jgi:phage terminase large subunit-like protein